MQRLILGALLTLIFYKPAFAVSTSILQYPTTIGDESFSLTVSVEGASAGVNYLRADLYLPDTKNYFGETDNTQYWYGGSDGKLFFPATIESGTPLIATFSARLGTPTSTDYPGPGSYKLRVRRYTSSGNQGSEDPKPVDITITKATPTPTPSPIPSSTPTPSVVPSPTPTPIPSVASPVPSKVVATPSPSIVPTLASPDSGTVSGESTIDLSSFGLHSPAPTESTAASASSPSLTLNSSRTRLATMVGSGLILISTSLYLWFRRRNQGIIT